ncbi:MAG: ABC transporter permease [Pyrinomonadaceae bacterium]|jgi:ABC-2 type transport system permease protein|nr:ABC transporter permease [Pyrinomonadaceae bacterium]
MRKFLAVLKREYFKIVWTWTFLISTLIAPLVLVGFTVVPMLMFSITGKPTRLIIVDQSGKVSNRIKANLSAEKQLEKFKKATEDALKKVDATQQESLKTSAQQMGGSFAFVDYNPDGKPKEAIRQELNERIQKEELDAYLIVPDDFESNQAKFDFFSRKSSDFVTNEVLKSAVEESVRSERLIKANISEDQLKEINRKVEFTVTKISDKGEEKADNFAFAIGFGIGLIIYMSLTLYGSIIMGAVIEEKETRIAEILFSSAKPFELMMGKLFGVGLASITQIGIWLLTAATVFGYFFAVGGLQMAGFEIPSISPQFVIFFLLFFFFGFFCYATIYAIIGAMVTTSQEGQQFVFPPILISIAGLYSIFPVIRDPNSTYSFFASIAPFISPIVMPVRIWVETPPFWQIALAILINVCTILLTTWIAAKVYRIGMLMYGKRATIPEVWRWIRTS